MEMDETRLLKKIGRYHETSFARDSGKVKRIIKWNGAVRIVMYERDRDIAVV